ncbi:hypothetical protein WR25_01539 [Diploscapter pachys]|uniref:Dynactin subunit 2 n=1 Tax=Diploscapter pachys TaxID=2018661 RepID=A0A2A2LE35_9BILA|nr:hypothetical protein WR25_01539 [Diploscapter pachys]
MSFNTKEDIFESEGTPRPVKQNNDSKNEAQENENIELTLEQKFTRLTYEINDLAGQLQADNSKATKAMDKESVEALLSELKAIQVAKASGEMKPSAEKAPTQKESAGTKSQSNASLIHLEKRLARIESLIGAATAKEDKQPVVDALEDLKFRVEALNPTYIESLESRLNALIAKNDQLEEKQGKSSQSGIDLAKVDELLALMQKWDASCAALPSNVRKIQSLHRLHEQCRISQLNIR